MCVITPKFKTPWVYMRTIFAFLIILIAGCETDNMTNLHTLGNDEFTKEKWRSASQSERGKIAASFLETYEVTNMDVQELRSLLGQSTAYYEYDEFPAYLIGPENKGNNNENSTVLAFPIDRKTGKISSYIAEPVTK